MSGRLDYISPEGLRLDGRRAGELRKISCRVGVLSNAHGSAYYEQGNTKILAAVYGPMEAKKGKGLHDRAVVTCEYEMTPFCSGEHRVTGKGNRRSMEISLALKQTFEEVILVQQFPGSMINIFVQVLQADGGTRCATINAISAACVTAGIPMKDMVVACAAGCIDNTPILDLNYLEDSARGVDMPVAILPQTDKVVLMQMDYRVDLETYEMVLKLAVEGCHSIYSILLQEVKNSQSSFAKS